ncbi:MAG: glycosyltransferase family 4 protein [Bacteroidota bacterium]
MKVITIYTTSDYPFGGPAENFVRQMALGLKENGQSVRIVLLKGQNKKQKNDTKIPYVSLLFSKRPKNGFLKLIQLLFIFLTVPYSLLKNKIKRNSKIIILYGVEYFHLMIPFLIMKYILNLKVYRIITDRYPKNVISPIWWKTPKILFYNFQYKYIDKFLDGIICLSSFLKESSIKYGVKKNKIIVIPHFIDLSFFKVSKSLPRDNEKIRIGMCGTLNRQNGILELIKAYKIIQMKHPNVELLLVGPIKNDIIKEINKIFSSLDDNSIIITGKVDSQYIPDYLYSCDILVNPRRSGIFADAGFPTKLGEYFASRKPVVATSVGDIKIYFQNQKELILVDPNSIHSLANGICFLIENKCLAKDIALNGYKWASENLDYKKSAQRLINFIYNKKY